MDDSRQRAREAMMPHLSNRHLSHDDRIVAATEAYFDERTRGAGPPTLTIDDLVIGEATARDWMEQNTRLRTRTAELEARTKNLLASHDAAYRDGARAMWESCMEVAYECRGVIDKLPIPERMRGEPSGHAARLSLDAHLRSTIEQLRVAHLEAMNERDALRARVAELEAVVCAADAVVLADSAHFNNCRNASSCERCIAIRAYRTAKLDVPHG
jgi:hypothetical protein